MLKKLIIIPLILCSIGGCNKKNPWTKSSSSPTATATTTPTAVVLPTGETVEIPREELKPISTKPVPTKSEIVLPTGETIKIPEVNSPVIKSTTKPITKPKPKPSKSSELVTVVFPSGETIKVPDTELNPTPTTKPATTPQESNPPTPRKKQYYFNITPQRAIYGALIILTCAAAIMSLQKLKKPKPPVKAIEAARLPLTTEEKLPGLKEVSKFGVEEKQKIELTINPVVTITEDKDDEE